MEKERKRMEFLKEILGEGLFNQVVEKINAHNGNEANKDKQVKIENINSGNYVSKLKYDDISQQLTGKDVEIANANKLIGELKKASNGNEEMQKKITDYETENARLQEELQETKIKSAVKVGLLSEHCNDVDYVTFKLMESLKEKGEKLELDENENIKGWDEKLTGLKTQLPARFEGGNDANKDGFTLLDNKGLPKDHSDKTVTKEQFLKMSVDERIALKQQNEKLYQSLRG